MGTKYYVKKTGKSALIYLNHETCGTKLNRQSLCEVKGIISLTRKQNVTYYPIRKVINNMNK